MITNSPQNIYDSFLLNIPSNWRDIFIDEFDIYGDDNSLKWFYVDNIFVWWVWIWYNPDQFEDIQGQDIIKWLLENWFVKISYFYIVDSYKWNLIGKEKLLEIISKSGVNYFLTCNWDKLKQYYIDLWFEFVDNDKNKNILIYNHK